MSEETKDSKSTSVNLVVKSPGTVEAGEVPISSKRTAVRVEKSPPHSSPPQDGQPNDGIIPPLVPVSAIEELQNGHPQGTVEAEDKPLLNTSCLRYTASKYRPESELIRSSKLVSTLQRPSHLVKRLPLAEQPPQLPPRPASKPPLPQKVGEGEVSTVVAPFNQRLAFFKVRNSYSTKIIGRKCIVF